MFRANVAFSPFQGNSINCVLSFAVQYTSNTHLTKFSAFIYFCNP